MKISRRRLINGCAVILARMWCVSSGLQERRVIWETPDLLAYLHPSPWTPGVAVVTPHPSPWTPQRCVGAGGLFLMPEEAFLRVLVGARALALLLCERLSVQRCALVHAPQEGAGLHVVPLHGLQSPWKPHLAPEEEFNAFDPGYISSKSGPRWANSDLEAVRRRIRAHLPDPDAAPDFSFLGDPCDPGLFPRIVRGEEEQWRVWEDEAHVAFLTPFPNTPGLTVLVPRKPLSSDVFRLEEDDYRRLVLAARTVARLLGAGLGAWGVGLIFEGFEIDYAHAKLIPLVPSPDEAEAGPDEAEVCPAHEFFERYPGYVTSVCGPPADRERLQEIWARIAQS